MLVLVDGYRSGLAAGHRDRRDFLGEIARCDRCSSALLRADRERVLIGARNLELLGDVLAGFRHRIDAVLRLHQRIDEAPADGGVVNFGRTRKRFRRLAHHERRPRHRFDAAGDIDFAIAGGVESMTRAPFVMGKAAEAFSRSADIYDTTIGWRFINPLMKAQYGVDAMPETGENVAEEFQVSRADQDAF